MIAVVTINRPVAYLPRLIESAKRSDVAGERFAAFVGNQDSSYLPEGFFSEVHCLPDAVRKNHGNHIDSVVNHAGAILRASTVLEDDVELSPRFSALLKTGVDECYRLRPGGHFLLSLCSDQIWPRGAAIVPYPLSVYSGSMGTYIPPELQFDLHRFLISNLDGGLASPDVMLAEYCSRRGIPLYCCAQSIVRHIGVQSATTDRQVNVECPTFAE